MSYTEVAIKRIFKRKNIQPCKYLTVKIPNQTKKNIHKENHFIRIFNNQLSIFAVRQYNPNCLLLTGEEAEECEAARVSGQLDGVPW